MKFQCEIRKGTILLILGMCSSCAQWVQQTEGFISFRPKDWCHQDGVYERNFNDCIIHQEYRNLQKVAPYDSYIKRPVILQRDMYVYCYKTPYNPEAYKLFGEKLNAEGEKMAVLPKGSVVKVHCVQGEFKYRVNKITGQRENISNDVVALVEFADPWNHKTVYGTYQWADFKTSKNKDGYRLYTFLNRAPWESLSTPNLRPIKEAGFPDKRK